MRDYLLGRNIFEMANAVKKEDNETSSTTCPPRRNRNRPDPNHRDGLEVSVIATHPQSCCPLCLQSSSQIHSHYHRTLKDAPCVGRQLQLSLTVRKFFCRNLTCSQKVFTERIPELAEPWARMTIRLKEHITSIGLATCGTGGVRLADRLGIETSRNTTLRRIMEVPDDARASVVYLGVDDFSFRCG